MTDMTAKAPYNPEKPHELHDQAKVKAPGPVTRDFLSRHLGIIAGIVMTIVFVALAFWARAGWDNHREWVVATTVPLAAIAGVAFGNLVQRREFTWLFIGVVLLILCALLTAGNIWRGHETEGPDGLRDALSIIQGILLVLAGICFVIGLVLMEWKNPIRAPQPEM